jgi:hypothetical protein
LIFLLAQCQKSGKPDTSLPENSEEMIQAKKLSVKYCAGCHPYPEPSLATATWRKLLPVTDVNTGNLALCKQLKRDGPYTT